MIEPPTPRFSIALRRKIARECRCPDECLWHTPPEKRNRYPRDHPWDHRTTAWEPVPLQR